ncbi:pyrroloquinoline quinone precursor peptide PqqA [Trinickia symbiotica]|nr:pyrroloquinoline quinone precursor peptide PqqA [Trinickia symbiotica]
MDHLTEIRPATKNDCSITLLPITATQLSPNALFPKGRCRHRAGRNFPNPTQESNMHWTKPHYEDLRLGFEITMYISTR